MKSLSIVALAALSSFAQGEVKLPALFSDHAVLQRDIAAPVWGTAAPGEKVTVSIAGQSQSATADASGKWSVKFASLSAGGPHELSVKGSNEIIIKDVLIGEAWLGSGQSNMAMTVNRAKDYEAEKAAATEPTIRMFIEKSSAATNPQTECKGTWLVCSPETVGGFSATLYFFGREIQRDLKVPVGLINSSVGGTPIESWIDADTQRAKPELAGFFKPATKPVDIEQAKALYQKQLAKWTQDVKSARADKKPLPRKPRDPVETQQRKGNIGGLFNGKIAPLVGYGIRGALWYQGEANAQPGKSPFYQHQLALLVQDWRQRWGYEFPFAWVQLPNFAGRADNWCEVREGMFKTLRLPHTGMAVTIDIGDERDIHPKNKQEVGRRLSLWALGSVYGRQVAISGPRFSGHEINGSSITVNFTHTDGGLLFKGEPKGFVVAGEDQKWQEASAKIEGDKLILTSPQVTKPVAARYAWSDLPPVPLWNGAGLPASPFRTDDWQMPEPPPAPVRARPKAK